MPLPSMRGAPGSSSNHPHFNGPSSGGRSSLGSKYPSYSKSGAKPARASGPSRRRKIVRDNIRGITKPAIRRLARRAGVKRISAMIYKDAREVIKERLEMILKHCVTYVEYRQAKTITVQDVLFSLRQIGRPIYGFDPDTYP